MQQKMPSSLILTTNLGLTNEILIHGGTFFLSFDNVQVWGEPEVIYKVAVTQFCRKSFNDRVIHTPNIIYIVSILGTLLIFHTSL